MNTKSAILLAIAGTLMLSATPVMADPGLAPGIEESLGKAAPAQPAPATEPAAAAKAAPAKPAVVAAKPAEKRVFIGATRPGEPVRQQLAAVSQTRQVADPAAATRKAEKTKKPAESKDAAKPKARTAKAEKKDEKGKKVADNKQARKQKEKAAEKAAPQAQPREPIPFMFGLFNAPKPKLEPLNEDQLKHDASLASVPEKKKFKVPEKFEPRKVPFKGYKVGSIVIDTKTKYLYFVDSPVSAIRYAVAVGKEGLLFTGKATVGAKQAWPRWTPTKDMIAREPKKYSRYADGMDGGPDNPLGARAIYLYQGKQDTYLRIHGTTAPETIGTASSNGCFRMINEHVIDLYKRVQMGAEVIVL